MSSAVGSMHSFSLINHVIIRWLILSIGLSLVACGSSDEVREFAGQQQGTTYHIKVVIDPSKTAEIGLRERIEPVSYTHLRAHET